MIYSKTKHHSFRSSSVFLPVADLAYFGAFICLSCTFLTEKVIIFCSLRFGILILFFELDIPHYNLVLHAFIYGCFEGAIRRFDMRSAAQT